MVPLFQWNLKFLPLVKCWFENATSPDVEFDASIRNRELSAVYQFVRGLPMLVVCRNANRSPKFNSTGAEHPR
eukprot:scaffold6450_cov147-Skeletonema_dohrnii-CCMP3373.AAC.1